MKSFVHLHLHSQFSLLDSSLKLEGLIEQTKAHNMPAVALTDHGNILGAVNFYKQAKKSGVKPIIGSELYLASGSRFDKPNRQQGEINYFHLLVLVKNEAGYYNLCNLISKGFTEGFYRKPRIDKELLAKYHEGLVVLSACIQGEIPYLLLHNRPEEARKAAIWYRDIFGDDFYLEIQNHGLPQQIEVIDKMVPMAQELSIPMVATNDVHYLKQSDSDVREILICLQTKNVLSDPNRAMKKETDQMYFKSTVEMAALFGHLDGVLERTIEVAAKCNYDFKLGTYYLPKFVVPEAMTVDGYFEQVCREGFSRMETLLANKAKPLKVYRERLDYEIEKIREMGFPGYFLIVWDIIRFAREVNIPVGPGRGSVVGSLVAFVMGITSLDPLDYDLIFERFLNPERISMPDIDMDFDGERRDEIIQYIRTKYGEASTAQIVTFGKMKAKMAIRDIGRVLEIPLADVSKIAKLIPEGPKVSLSDELKNNNELIKEIQRVHRGPELVDFALKLENNVRNTSMHAAGVVIAPKELTHYMPLYRSSEDIVTQFEKEEVEQIGLLKMDILGLKTLTIIKNILREVKDVDGVVIDLDHIPLDDPKTYDIFQKGDTDGVFQFESGGMRDFLTRSKPSKLEDLIVLNGLYRPGPLNSGMAEQYVNRKLGKEAVVFLFPEIEPILADTYGIIVFQEQVMQISVTLAGFSMSKADEMRKIMGKKATEKMPAIEAAFMEGGSKRGHKKELLKEIFSQMATFAEYGFNKSHSAAYAYLAYQTGYLKAHYPVYFMAAHLTSEADKTSTMSKMIQYISESKKMGFRILNPTINRSIDRFRVEDEGSIRFGFMGLKNVGTSAIESILLARRDGPFKDFSDFLARVDQTKVNRGVLEFLIKAGVFDEFELTRRGLYEGLDELLAIAAAVSKREGSGQLSLFTEEESPNRLVVPAWIKTMPEWEEKEIISGEKEVSGLYLSINPVEKYREEIVKVSNTTIADLVEFEGDRVRIGGVVTAFNQRKSKKGDLYGEIFFEDLTGRIKVLVFNRKGRRPNGNGNEGGERQIWDEIKETLKLDHPYILEAQLPTHDDQEINLYLDHLVDLESFLRKQARKIVIKVAYERIDDEFCRRLQTCLTRNEDGVPYIIVVNRDDGYRTLIGSSQGGRGLRPTLDMKMDIESITGTNSVEILY
jgi:DNA polymerase-3 subunit alpha